MKITFFLIPRADISRLTSTLRQALEQMDRDGYAAVPNG